MIFRGPYPDVTIPEVPLTPFVLQRAQELGWTAGPDVAGRLTHWHCRARAGLAPSRAAGPHPLGASSGSRRNPGAAPGRPASP